MGAGEQKMEYITHSPEETEKSGGFWRKRWNRHSDRLPGDWGPGKTASPGALPGDWDTRQRDQPTTPIVNEYLGADCPSHFDMSLGSSEDLWTSLEDYLSETASAAVE